MAVAADLEEQSGCLSKRKRRKTRNQKKLLVDAKVEVRSLEDGFQGSWHPGIVTACGNKGRREVQYEHLLCDDGSDNLVEVVSVSPILDGIGSLTGDWSNYRGTIRPTPLHVQPMEWNLPYGLCVDVYHQEAWWEGVIFDHEDGSKERRVFFPDLGDELKPQIDTMRITHDWDEVTEDWKPRGTWIFLELLERYDQESYIPVSAKQIWYDVRRKKGFQNIKDWTSPMRNLWEDLVLEAINDNTSITVDEIFGVLDKSGFFSLETQVELDSTHFITDANMTQENMEDSLAIVTVDDPLNNCLLGDRGEWHENGGLPTIPDSAGDEGQDMNHLEYANVSFQNKGVCVQPQVLSAVPSTLAGSSCSISVIRNGGIPSTSSKGKSSKNWLLLDHPAVFCPDAVDEYADLVKGMPPKFTATDVRQHLSYLGWKMYSENDKGFIRHRYLSPDGECEYSLRQVCKKLKKPKKDTHHGLHVPAAPPLLVEQSPESQHPNYCPQMVGTVSSKVFILKPEYCPEAVKEYYMNAKDKTIKKALRKMIVKAKKHLSAVGWVFWYPNIKSPINLRYRSPDGIVYRTLLSACKRCMGGGYEKRPAECMYVAEEDEGLLTRNKVCSAPSDWDMQEGLVPSKTLSKKRSRDSIRIPQSSTLVELDNVQVRGRKRRRKRHNNLSDLAPKLLQRQSNLHIKDGSTEELIGDEKLECPEDHCAIPPKLKRRKGSGAFDGLRNIQDGNQRTRVLRSSKRVQEVVTPSSSHKIPRTVLSWLIDNNEVLPRAKVSYRNTKDSHPLKEGKIHHEGIKCSCCKEMYNLSCFGSHAGSSCGRPSANIFLEDGRSILDCQKRVMHKRRKSSFRKESRDRMQGNWRRGENDYICTVCHYGGDLILCDRCPSSFHQSCLGLEDVPDGDWFCASCQCGICQINFNEDEDPIMDDNGILTCCQCEHKYHKGCLRKSGADNLESEPNGNWFCSKNCKKIFSGLFKRLGKQIPLDEDNLSWSILKFNNCDSRDADEPDIYDALTESYSRLSVALDVMHECFVPVKEPRTKRDLVEDVLFCRGSDLNRLNFRGFYTVLLERNDELITVATVRIFGDKVAEVPLVGTRFQYRRLGMCRILMDELEKMLMELGVERLVLPAVHSVLHTWTTSFGFSPMAATERLNFIDYTFLDFQGTIMCQKLLTKNPPAESSPLKGSQLDLYGDICQSRDNTEFDGSSSVSEVYEAEQIEDGGNLCHRVDNAAGNGSSPCVGENSPELFSSEAANHKGELVNNGKGELVNNGNDGYKFFKCYKRRRVSANGKLSCAISSRTELTS